MARTDLLDVLMQWQNAGIAVVSMWLIDKVKRAFPHMLENEWVVRLMPFSPVLLTSAMVWLPVHDPVPTSGERILLGLILGAVSGWMYKLIRQTFRRRTKDGPTIGKPADADGGDDTTLPCPDRKNDESEAPTISPDDR